VASPWRRDRSVVLLEPGECLPIRGATELAHPLKLATPLLQLLLVSLPSGDANSEICEGGLQVEQFAADAQPVLYLLWIHDGHCRLRDYRAMKRTPQESEPDVNARYGSPDGASKRHCWNSPMRTSAGMARIVLIVVRAADELAPYRPAESRR
jgi:hypothetical protein